MIEEYSEFKEPVGVSLINEFEMEKDRLSEFNTGCQDPTWYCLLSAPMKAGLLRYTTRDMETRKREGKLLVKIELTDEGKKYVTGEGSHGSTLVKGCETRLLRVTGIALSEFGQKGASVEYEWTYDNPTVFGNLAVPWNGAVCRDKLGEIQKDEATFLLYDDGWRVTNLHQWK